MNFEKINQDCAMRCSTASSTMRRRSSASVRDLTGGDLKKGCKESREDCDVEAGRGLVRMLSKRLFWDVPIESLEDDVHKRFIVQRVLERGGVNDIRLMMNHYSLSVVAEEAREIRSLDPITLAFASCLINEPEENFRCYTSKQ